MQQKQNSWFQKLQIRWGVQSIWQVLIILLVFAMTGFTILYIKKHIFQWLGIGTDAAVWLRIIVSIFVILPVYQVVLLFYGSILGQFKFFWEFEKRMFQRIANIFR